MPLVTPIPTEDGAMLQAKQSSVSDEGAGTAVGHPPPRYDSVLQTAQGWMKHTTITVLKNTVTDGSMWSGTGPGSIIHTAKNRARVDFKRARDRARECRV